MRAGSRPQRWPSARRNRSAPPSGYRYASEAAATIAARAGGGTPNAPSLDDSFTVRLAPAISDSPATYGLIVRIPGRGVALVIAPVLRSARRSAPGSCPAPLVGAG